MTHEEPPGTRRSRPSSFARRLGRGIDCTRHVVVNALFVGALVGLAAVAWRARPRVPDGGAALVLDPKGLLVEQLSGGSGGWLARELTAAAAPRETLVRDVLDALRLARDDRRIAAVVLDVDDLRGGMSKLRDVREALLAVRAAGKRIVAYADGLSQGPYYLAAVADELILHPEGLVFLEGFGGYRPYFRETLDRFGIRLHVFRVGEYKSAVEPYLRSDMSPEAREAALDVYGDLWRVWLGDVAAARGLGAKALRETVEAWPERVRAADGDLARAALAAGLVDELAPRDRLRRRMVEIVGADEDGKTFRQVGFATYLAARGRDRRVGRGSGVAVVVARGDILDGTQPPGRIGGDSTAALVRRAREDEHARAVVLRLDSPGGSVFGADVIRRECELTREAGKPLVVSMGSVAASGGYWIATSADEIWASPTTITGSIGIFGLFPDVHEALARHLGVHLDGAGTTPWTDAFNPGRPLDPAVASVIQDVVDDGYEDFLAHVARARGMSRESVDRVARGRIWSGADAHRLGLVDALGDLDDAVAAAASRASLGDGYRVFYVEQEPTLRTRLVRTLRTAAASLAAEEPASREPRAARTALERARSAVEDELDHLARWNDPRGVYAHCLCGEEWP